MEHAKGYGDSRALTSGDDCWSSMTFDRGDVALRAATCKGMRLPATDEEKV